MNQKNGFITLFLLISVLFADNTKDKISLWEIKGKQNSVYLVGSLHLLKESDYPLDSQYYRAFDKVSTVAFEVDMDSAKSFTNQLYILGKSKLPASTQLPDVLPDSTYKKCEKVFASMGGSLKSLHAFKPFFVGTTLSILKMQQMGYDPEIGIDRHFFELAKEKGKKTLGLEDIKFQIDLLFSLDEQNEGNFLETTLQEISQYKEMIGAMNSYWRQGDAEKLDSLINASLYGYPKLKDKLLLNRNKSWMVSIEKFLAAKHDVMVVVGAGHVGGEDGLLHLLKKRGFTVRQLSRLY